MSPIDADELIEQFKPFFHMDEKIEPDVAIEMIRAEPTITPPPNPPLTLNDLLEMDGEPVWISPVKATGKIPARWMLVSGYNSTKDIYLFAPQCNITQGYEGKSYGKTWLAYRRKPEVSTP